MSDAEVYAKLASEFETLHQLPGRGNSKPLDVSCRQCGGVFKAWVSAIRRGQGKYCSEICQHKAYQARAAATMRARFWQKVNCGVLCWEWFGSTSGGYGYVKVAGENVGAHCVAWNMAGGEHVPGFDILHTCDNTVCVRNDSEGWYEINGVLRRRIGHLWQGTHLENMADRDRKGRTNHVRGAAHPSAIKSLLARLQA